MKIRNGFVSNSSSSSFCIYGASINKEIVEAKAEEIKKLGLEIYYGNPNYASDEVSVGKSWCTIGDNETGAEFKKVINDLLKQIFDVDRCSTIEDAWYDG